MPNIRALTDLNILSIYVPHNRVAMVDDDTAAALVESGQATDDDGHVGQALLMNPEVIEIADPGTKPKAKPKPADPGIAESTTSDKGKKTAKTAPAAEEQAGLFGE